MDISNYINLPDSLTPEQTRYLFEQLLTAEPPQTPVDAVAMALAMDEVADRHWHTYTLLDQAMRIQIDNWVTSNWDPNSLEKVRSLLSIIAKLGLIHSAEMIRREIHSSIPPSVRNEIQTFLQEVGTTVADPYSGMKKPLR